MSAAYLHGDDDEFGQGLELPGKLGIYAWKALTESHGAIRRHDFKQYGEEAEGVLVCIFQSGALDDGDEEKAEEDEPEIERELETQMVREVARGFLFFLARRPDPEGFFLVHVGLADRHGDGENGNVHHYHVADLDGGVQVGNVDHGETGSAGGRGLEETSEEAVAGGERCDGRVAELLVLLVLRILENGKTVTTYIENDEEDQIHTIQNHQNPKQPPIRLAWKKQRKTSTWMIQQKPQLFPHAARLGHHLGVHPDSKP